RRYATALGIVAVAALLALVVGPGFVRNAANALFSFSRDVQAALHYGITVTPGTKQLHKGADQIVSATLSGFNADRVIVHSRRGPGAKWETAPLVPKDKTEFEGMLFDVNAPVEYYVEADGVTSNHYQLTVVELPYVQKLGMDFKYPSYTGMESQKVEDAGGDVASPRGTQITL